VLNYLSHNTNLIEFAGLGDFHDEIDKALKQTDFSSRGIAE
jgi:hypothetical protein